MTRPWLNVFQGLKAAKTPRMVCDIEGDWPTELHGTFYRNGPGLLEFGRRRYQHWLDGDGLVQAWNLMPSSRVIHQSRMVETKKYLFTEKRRELSRIGHGSMSKDGWSTLDAIALNVGNSNIVTLGDELWALWEGGQPWQLDQTTLATLGLADFSASSAGLAFGAHPRMDSEGTIWNIGVNSERQSLLLWAFSARDLQPKFRLSLVEPMSLPHDFVISQNYVVVLIPPFHFNPSGSAEQSYLDAHDWHPEKSTKVRVMAKTDLSKSFELELPAQWYFHFTNAWEDEKNNIRFQGVRYRDPRLLTHGYKAVMRGEGSRRTLKSDLVELTINTRRKRLSAETFDLNVNSCEYPTYDQRINGRQHDWVTVLAHSGQADALQKVGLLNSVLRVNVSSGAAVQHTYSENELAEEHIYIPRTESSGESDGWLLGTTLNYVENQTFLNVHRVNGATLEHVARAILWDLMPIGLHGHFVRSA